MAHSYEAETLLGRIVNEIERQFGADQGGCSFREVILFKVEGDHQPLA